MPEARGLTEYNRKRNFARTAEPKGERRKSGNKLSFVIQKHAARRLHYDFRLEWNGRLLSWAVPKGPSENPDDKRLAVHVEDHPIEYGKFEGTIPQGEYGGGTVMLWDRGTWEPHGDVDEGLRKGKLSFELHGKRLHGRWALVRLRGGDGGGKENWLLIKERDDAALDDGKHAVDTEIASVATGRSMEEIAQGKRVWHSNRATDKAAAGLNGNGKAVAKAKSSGRSTAKPAAKSTAKSTGKSTAKSTGKSSTRVAAQASRSKKNSGAKLPAFVSPQLATLVDEPPAGDDWLHEIKFDGYRAVTGIGDGNVKIWTRKGLDWTDRFHALVPSLSELPCDSALLDGEIAVADTRGHTDFGALQNALSSGGAGIGYYIFDLLHLDGEDLRPRPLSERKDRLAQLLRGAVAPLVYSDHMKGSGAEVFGQACKLKLEGIVSKRRDVPYVSGRTKSWLKTKCGMAQEFVIIGWRPSTKAGRPFSSLLLGLRDNGDLRYAGRVGSGYSEAGLENLSSEFKKLARKDSPASGVPRAIARHARFLEPKLGAEIAFRGWTRDGLVRQGSFKGLRTDKPASEIVRERAMPSVQAVKSAKSEPKQAPKQQSRSKHDDEVDEFAGVRMTHPDRLLFAGLGVTKRDLVEYYLQISDLILPHVARRPLALVRCPEGSGTECFFQKHASAGFPDQFGRVRIKEKSATREYMTIDNEAGLVAAVQVGVLELHIWCSRVETLEKPDRMVFDFDPDEDLPFAKVRDAAKDMRARLKDLGLESFPMATGGKGIHVVVPLQPKHSWDEHRNFAEALARLMAEEEPDRFVANMSKAKRKGKIFVDYLRNTRGSTAICPYSTRTRPGAFVATPVSWPQLSRLKDARPATVKDAKRLLAADPWPDYFKIKQTLPVDKLLKGRR